MVPPNQTTYQLNHPFHKIQAPSTFLVDLKQKSPEGLKRKARQRQEAPLFTFGLEPNSLEFRDTHLLVLYAPLINGAYRLGHVTISRVM
jgi:hypothetical protein